MYVPVKVLEDPNIHIYIYIIGRRLKYFCKTGKKLTMQRVFLKKKNEGILSRFATPQATAEGKETSISPHTSAELAPGKLFMWSWYVMIMVWSYSHTNAGDVSGVEQSPIPMLTSSTVPDDGQKTD